MKEELSETELFLLKLNACYEPELSVKGTQKAIQIIEDLQQENKQLRDKIEKLKDYGEKVGEIRNQLYDKIDKAIKEIKTRTDYEVRFKKLLEILGDKENENNNI